MQRANEFMRYFGDFDNRIQPWDFLVISDESADTSARS